MRVTTSSYGKAVAAYMSAMVGVLTLAFVNVATEISAGAKEFVHNIGKLWMPAAEKIGPYSGKETIALVGWLGRWFVFYLLLKNKKCSEPLCFFIFLIGVVFSSMLLWPPVTHLVVELF